MSFSIETLQRSARLVRAWRATRVNGGQTLGDALTIDGISWWDVAAPNLAAFYLPPYLSVPSPASAIKRRIKPYLGSLKSRLARRRARLTQEACRRWPSEPSCVVLGFSPYIYRDVLQPVVEQLATVEGLRPVVLYDASAESAAADGDVWHSVWDHWDADAARDALTLTAEFERAAAALRAPQALPAALASAGDVAWPDVKPLFDWLFMVYFPRLQHHAAAARHILRRHRPAAILSADVDDARNRLYCLIGRERGVPSLELQFGMCGSEAVEWQFFVADRLAVWGEQGQDVVKEHGVPADRIVVTGSPRHDRIVNRPGASAGDLRQRLGIPADQFVVLFASVHSGLADGARLAAVKQAIFRAADAAPGLALIVKPHPGESAEETQRLAGDARHVYFADRQEDIRHLITQCDAFVTLGSTATLDALLAGKTVIWPALEELVWWDDQFMNSGAVLVVRSEAELSATFTALAGAANAAAVEALEPFRRRFLDRWVYRFDGLASSRVVALLLESVRPAEPALLPPAARD